MTPSEPSEAHIEPSLGNEISARIWVFGDPAATVRELLRHARGQPDSPSRRAGDRIKPQLAALPDAGLLEPGRELTWDRPRLGDRLTATVTSDGKLRIEDGSRWPSPYQGAHRAAGHHAGGWVKFKTAAGRSLADLKASPTSPNPD